MHSMWQTIFEIVGSYLIAAIAVERITEVITAGEIFAPARSWAANKLIRSTPAENPGFIDVYGPYLHKLLTCSYCFSHWVAMPISLMLPGDYFSMSVLNNIFIKWIALVGFSNTFHALLSLMLKIGDVMLKATNFLSDDIITFFNNLVTFFDNVSIFSNNVTAKYLMIPPDKCAADDHPITMDDISEVDPKFCDSSVDKV